MTTSSFFRDKEDDIFGGGNFVFELARGLSQDNNIYILAPMSDISKKKNELYNLTIYRFKQFFIKNVDLAFGDGILPNLRKNRFKILMIPFFVIYQFLEILKIGKNEKIDILHCHWLLPQGLIGAIYKKLFNRKIKLVLTIHGDDLLAFNSWFFNKIKKFTINQFDEISVVSDSLQKSLYKLVPEVSNKILPMGTDTEIFRILEKDIDLLKIYGKDFKYVLFIGSFITRKGTFELVKAMKYVVESDSMVKLLLIGDGNLKNEMLGFAQENNLMENIEFVGFVPHNELPQYFSISHLFILPSRSEGFGLVVAEALACGVKPIVSNLDCFRDFVTSETGVFLDSINPEDIAKAILENIDSDNGKIEKELLRKGIVQKYSWKVISAEYDNIYKSVVN